MAQTKPDILCFATHPHIRMEYIDLAIKYGVKAISMEKPFALNMRDAIELKSKCDNAKIKVVVSVQHKYYSQYQKLKEVVDKQLIGRITRVVAETTPWMHILGTHLMDYILWITGRKHAEWVAGHVSGNSKLSDNHTSPDFLMGIIHFEDGLYANIECGYLSAPHLDKDTFWTDNRLTVFGENGYAWAETDSRFGICAPSTGGYLQIVEGNGISFEDRNAEVLFYHDLYKWMEDDNCVHPSCLEESMAAYEILTALCLSGLDNRRVDLPMGKEAYNVIERMHKEIPSVPVPEKLKEKGFFEHWGN